MNLDFDYRKYLDTLAADGLNYTRVFSGAYVEPQGAFNITRNTLAPQPNRFVAPWARSSQPGYANGGNKFDLTRWDAAYFARRSYRGAGRVPPERTRATAPALSTLGTSPAWCCPTSSRWSAEPR